MTAAKLRLLLPAGLMAVLAIGGLFALGSGPAGAAAGGAAGSSTAGSAGSAASPGYPACGGYSRYDLTTAPNSGAPNSSYYQCVDGKLKAYGDRYITYKAPPANLIDEGDVLFQQYCSSCHTPDAGGGSRAPNLRGVGPATVEFWVDTGRMPASVENQVEAPQKPPKLSPQQAEAVAAWVNSLDPATPFVPTVHLQNANVAEGASLFALNCAACHTITGAGDALAKNTYAPTLHLATPAEIAEAIRTGPGNMPRFSGNLSDQQVLDLVAYVSEGIQHPTDPGGNGLGGVGPVTEGFVGLLFGVGGLALVCFWIGDRAK